MFPVSPPCAQEQWLRGADRPHPCSWGWEAARAGWESPAQWLQLWQPVGWLPACAATELAQSLCTHGVSQFRARVPWAAGTAGRKLEPLGSSRASGSRGGWWPWVSERGHCLAGWTLARPRLLPAENQLHSPSEGEGKEQGMVELIRGYPLSHHTAPLLRTGLVHGWQWLRSVLSLLGWGAGRAG